MNKVILKGRLGRDVELRVTSTGKSVASASLAINRRGAKEGQPSADFIPLVIWGPTADNFSKYLSKGSEVLVEGRIQIRSYDDKNGAKKYITEVVVENFEFCGSKNNTSTSSAENDNGGFGSTSYADDIPF